MPAAFYPRPLPVARDRAGKPGHPAPWPDTPDESLTMCHERWRTKSARILLRYGSGDWNAPPCDVFRDMVFPLQIVIGLDVPGGARG